MLIARANKIPLLRRFRSSHVAMAGLFATLVILPVIGRASSAQTAAVGDAGSGKPIRLTFAQLAACPITGLVFQEPENGTGSLTDNVRSAAGKQVEVTGYMLPLVMEKGQARELLLMRNQMGCCYGQSPAANEYLVIKAPASSGLPVTMDVPVALKGTLRVAPVVMGGVVVEFYHLDNATLSNR